MSGVRRIRLAVVSAFPPSTGPLSEHGWHLVECLRRDPRIDQIYVLADRVAGAGDQSDSTGSVIRCWRFGSMGVALDIVKQARRLDVDAIWFNMHLSSFGNTRVSRLAGLAAPLVARLCGYTTLVTLHNLLGPTDLSETRLNARWFDVWGGHLATRLLRAADLVGVTRPEYADLMRTRYGLRRVRFIPLGTPGTPIKTICPASPRRGLLAFGHFGSNKRLEDLIEAVSELAARRADVCLSVGGKSSRYVSDYLDGLQRQYEGRPFVRFLGYVPEEQVPVLFERAAISVLPYGTVTGMSSVALQSAMYGAAILASDIEGFRTLEREGLRLTFYEWRNKASLEHAIEKLLDQSEDERLHDARANLAYCAEQPLDRVTREYLDQLEVLIGSQRSPGGSG